MVQDLGFDIAVVANHHRRPLVVDALRQVPHRLSFTPDADLPEGFQAFHPYGDYNPTGAYRCFLGHQQAAARGGGRPLLILEDDAVPLCSNWLEVVGQALPLLDHFEVVSFHGRDFDRTRWEVVGTLTGRSLWLPKSDPQATVHRVLGSLAYLIDEPAGQRLQALSFDGMPVDLLLASSFSFVLVDPSPFRHDRGQGSLIG